MKEKLAVLPAKPGVYFFRDEKGNILYVGKARLLKNRVRSYFQQSAGIDERKAAMVSSIADIEFTVTSNELEALILEASLIRQYRPRYNILLRDDKSYPYLKLTVNEEWPRLEVVRRIQKDGARYFGPYVPAGAMWRTLSFIRNHYHIPNCRYSLDKRIRPCIQHQMGRCVAPCSGELDHAGYMRMIREVELLLEGRNRRLLLSLEKTMLRLSAEMKYEEAAVVRDRIRAIEAISETQKVVSPGLGDIDVIGLFRKDGTAVIKIFFVRSDMITGVRDFRLKKTEAETSSYLLRNFMEQFYGREILPPPEVCCSLMPEDAGLLADWLSERRGAKVRIAAPLRGVRKKVVRMAEENAEEIAAGMITEAEIGGGFGIAGLLGLREEPGSIAAFDISNIAGKTAAGSYVFWENNRFEKSRYRHIRMNNVKGPDDYSMMREMIRRTINNIREGREAKGEGQRAKGGLAELIIIDGGREHLNAALEVFDSLYFPPCQGGIEGGDNCRPAVVGLAKDPDRVFLKDRPEPVLIDDSRPAALLLRRIRDEAHRFAISYHRKLRGRKAFESALDSIYGLGRKRRFALLERFGSIEAIRKASADEIAGLQGFTKKLAEEVLSALADKEK